MAVFIWYLGKSHLSSVQVYSDVHWTSYFIQCIGKNGHVYLVTLVQRLVCGATEKVQCDTIKWEQFFSGDVVLGSFNKACWDGDNILDQTCLDLYRRRASWTALTRPLGMETTF